MLTYQRVFHCIPMISFEQATIMVDAEELDDLTSFSRALESSLD